MNFQVLTEWTTSCWRDGHTIRQHHFIHWFLVRHTCCRTIHQKMLTACSHTYTKTTMGNSISGRYKLSSLDDKMTISLNVLVKVTTRTQSFAPFLCQFSYAEAFTGWRNIICNILCICKATEKKIAKFLRIKYSKLVMESWNQIIPFALRITVKMSEETYLTIERARR